MPCHYTGCCSGDAGIYPWWSQALYLLHLSICGSWQIQLRQHLGKIHNFPCFDWIPARDSLPDQMTCAHCGCTHSCLESLRKHIIYGHCHHFDANRAWTRNGDDDIVEHLWLGRVDLLLETVRCANDLLYIISFAPRHSLKPAIWSATFFINIVTLHRKLKHFNMFFSNAMLPGVAIACPQFAWSSRHINVLHSYNWAWCTTMETTFFPSLWPMIPEHITVWILILHYHVWTWFIIVSRLVTLLFFSRMHIFVGPFVIDAYAVERKWH